MLFRSDKYVSAICAAPSILGHMGILKGKEAVCFPGFEEQLDCAKVSDDFVCRDGRVITAKGAGVAQEFGFKLLECLKGKETADRIKASLQCR